MCDYKAIHPVFKVVGFDGTSRVYSENPSLSQVPKILRNAIRPHDGSKFLYTDLKAAEVYILVKWAKCKVLVDAYESGEDLYTVIAQKMFNKKSISKEERNKMKIVVLSILYGSNGTSAARELKVSEEEARGIVDKFMATFPEIAAFQARAYSYVVSHGYIQSFYFRPRILKGEHGEDSARKRQCVNSAIQNTCADAIKLCIGKHNLISNIKFVTTVFDSVLFEVPEEFSDDDAQSFLKRFFAPCRPFLFRFEYAMGKTWGEAQSNMH